MNDAITWLRGQRAAMEQALEQLVVCSSHTANKRGCDEVAERLRTLIPCACEVVQSVHFGDHLFFHNGSAPEVVLVGHHDTVFARDVFSGYRVEGDLARGPGVLDMKGGLVVIAFALQALRHAGVLGEIPLSVAVVSDEEVGSPESAALLRARARNARYALVFEAGRVGDAIITRRKGTCTLRVEATGKAAHAGNAHAEGASAIWSMARWIDRAQSLTDHARGITVNVGRIEGGTSKNTVPDRCHAEVDVRYVTLDDGEDIVRALRAAADEVCVPGTAITLTCETARTPLERTSASVALYERYAICQREASLGDAEAPLQGGGSDASTTASVGVPSIDGLGPRGKGFHTLDEQVDLTTLVPKAEALLRFLWSTRRG